MTGKSKNTEESAFTLIELLVVIGIIAILAAILFPVFTKLREKSDRILSIQREDKIGFAILQYVQDYDSSFPMGDQVNYTTKGQLYDWTMEVAPFLPAGTDRGQIRAGVTRVGGVWQDPGFPAEPIGQVVETNEFHAMEPIFMDYNNADSGLALDRPTHPSDVPAPQNQVMLFGGGLEGPQGATQSWDPNAHGFGISSDTPDSCWIGWTDCGTDTDTALLSDCDNFTHPTWGAIPWWAHIDGEMCGLFPRYRYGNTCNMLFVDGHVQSIQKGQLDYANQIYLPAVHNCFGGPPEPWCPLM